MHNSTYFSDYDPDTTFPNLCQENFCECRASLTALWDNKTIVVASAFIHALDWRVTLFTLLLLFIAFVSHVFAGKMIKKFRDYKYN